MSKTKIDGTLVKSGLKSVSNTVDRLLTTKYMKYQWRVETKNVFGTEDRTYYGDSCTLYVDQVDTANTPYFRGYTDDGVVMEYTVAENEITLGYKGTHIEYDGKVYTDLVGSIVLTSTSDITGYLSYDGNDSTGDIHLPINTVHVTAMNMGKVTDVNVSYNTDNGTATISWNYSTTYSGDVSYVIADEFGNTLYTTENKNITLPVGVENADYRIIVRWVVLDNFYKAPTYETVTVTGTDPSEPLPDHYTEFTLWNFMDDLSSSGDDPEYTFVVTGSQVELGEGEDIFVECIPNAPGARHRISSYSVDGVSGKLSVIANLNDRIRVYSPRCGSGMFSYNYSGDYKLTLNKFDSGWTSMVSAFNGCNNLYKIESWDGAEGYTDCSQAFSSCMRMKLIPTVYYAEMTEYGNLGAFDFSGLSSMTNAYSMFSSCSSLTTEYEIRFDDLTNVTNFNNMFAFCNNDNTAQIYTVDFSALPYDDTRTNSMIAGMFNGTYIDIKSFGHLGTVLKNGYTYAYQQTLDRVSNHVCNILTWDGIEYCDGINDFFVGSEVYNLPSSWNGFNVRKASGWFTNCTRLTEIPSSWAGAESLVIIDSMFRGCTGLTQIPNSWSGLGNVVSMDSLFNGCPITSGGGENIETFTKVYASGNMLTSANDNVLTPAVLSKMSRVLNNCTLYWANLAGVMTKDYTYQASYQDNVYCTSHSMCNNAWATITDLVTEYYLNTYGITHEQNAWNNSYWNGRASSMYKATGNPGYDSSSGWSVTTKGAGSVSWATFWANEQYYHETIVPITISDRGDMEYYYLG